MKTCPSLEDLALFAGCDLDAAAMTSIETHAAGCDACRKRIAELQEDRELLRTPPAIPEPAYMQVRSGVLSELERRHRRPRYLWATAAAAAALLACLLPLSIRRTTPPPPNTLPVAASSRPDSPQERPLDVGLKPRVRAKKKLSVRPALPTDGTKLFEAVDALLETKEERRQSFSGSVMVELKTQDPNVTIILLEESTGGAE